MEIIILFLLLCEVNSFVSTTSCNFHAVLINSLYRNLVVPSNLSIHQVTAKDVVGIPTVELKTEVNSKVSFTFLQKPTNVQSFLQSIIGGFKQQKFYCAIHLKSLAQEKHGEKYHGPQLLEVDDNDKLQEKSDLVSCCTLLHGGQPYIEHLAYETTQCGFDSVGQTLSLEFVSQSFDR